MRVLGGERGRVGGHRLGRDLLHRDQVRPGGEKCADRSGRVGIHVADVVLHRDQVVGRAAVRDQAVTEDRRPGRERQDHGDQCEAMPAPEREGEQNRHGQSQPRKKGRQQAASRQHRMRHEQHRHQYGAGQDHPSTDPIHSAGRTDPPTINHAPMLAQPLKPQLSPTAASTRPRQRYKTATKIQLSHTAASTRPKQRYKTATKIQLPHTAVSARGRQRCETAGVRRPGQGSR
jgi:hypothetical protein